MPEVDVSNVLRDIAVENKYDEAVKAAEAIVETLKEGSLDPLSGGKDEDSEVSQV